MWILEMLIFKSQISLTVIVSSHIYFSGNRNRTWQQMEYYDKLG